MQLLEPSFKGFCTIGVQAVEAKWYRQIARCTDYSVVSKGKPSEWIKVSILFCALRICAEIRNNQGDQSKQRREIEIILLVDAERGTHWECVMDGMKGALTGRQGTGR